MNHIRIKTESGSATISTRIDEKEMNVTLFREKVKVNVNDLGIVKRLIKSSELVKKVGTGKTDMRVTSVLKQVEDVAKKLADNDQTSCYPMKERKS
jgi:hypothetical protein